MLGSLLLEVLVESVFLSKTFSLLIPCRFVQIFVIQKHGLFPDPGSVNLDPLDLERRFRS